MELTQPEKAGFSRQRLQRINSLLQSYVDRKTYAGFVSLVARHGKVVHFEKFGMQDIEAGKPMQLDTLFRIYSMSKPITSAAVMMLFEEGLFRLNDPLSLYLPAFKHVKVFIKKTESGLELADLKREITIRDLLTHTAGLSYGFDDKDYIDQLYQQRVWALVDQHPETTLEAWIREVACLPLVYQPGSAWRYSIAIDVLGLLVQVVSGIPFEQFLQERIFAPLGMVDTAFWVPPEKLERFSAVYEPSKEGGLKVIDEPHSSRYTRPPKAPSGGGGLVSTATDYFRFCQMLLNKGELDGVRLLGRKTVELMMMDHLPKDVHWDDPTGGFGLGGAVQLDIAASQMPGSVGKFTWGGLANTKFWIDPKEDLIGILMLQFIYPEMNTLDMDFNNAVYQGLVD